MAENKYYILTNLITNEQVLVNTIEDLVNVTECEKPLISYMIPGEVRVINHWEIMCEETKPQNMIYYKNLWR